MSLSLMSEGKPLISVIMPVYNAERYLADAVNSILTQTYPHFEFIIVDDGSTDGSANIVREFASRDSRIRPLYLPHHGQAVALNAGVALAQGKFVAHMDNDDIALPERFAIQLNWMRQTGVDVCGGQLKAFGNENKILWFPETHHAICHELLFRIGLHHGTSLVRMDIAKTHIFNVEALHVDYEILTRLALRYRLGNVPQVLLRHRCHSQQAHVVYNAVFFADAIKYRRPYFHALFPEATEDDYAGIAHIAESRVCPDLPSLERGGKWLVRLAQTPDVFLHQRMANRWLAACQRSAHLGMNCHRLYREILPEFNVPVPESAWHLRLQCALRMRTGSRAYTILKRLRGVLRSCGIRGSPDGARHQARNKGDGGGVSL